MSEENYYIGVGLILIVSCFGWMFFAMDSPWAFWLSPIQLGLGLVIFAHGFKLNEERTELKPVPVKKKKIYRVYIKLRNQIAKYHTECMTKKEAEVETDKLLAELKKKDKILFINYKNGIIRIVKDDIESIYWREEEE